MIKLFKPWPWANYLWVGEEVSLEFIARLTCIVHEVGLEGCGLAEGAEGERRMEAVELLGAWQKVHWHYSFIVPSLSTDSLTRNHLLLIKKQHMEFCTIHTDTHTLAWCFSPHVKTNVFSYILHAVHYVNACSHALCCMPFPISLLLNDRQHENKTT